MPSPFPDTPESLGIGRLATGRATSLFAPDVERRRADIDHALRGARVLVIGAAGSIGGATVRQLLTSELAALHAVDTSENELVELTRDLHGSARVNRGTEFRAMPIDFGSEVFHRVLLAAAPYDYVLNFAAVKHVRSEKDVFSLLHMLDTNVMKQARVIGWLHKRHPGSRYFSVSTDKAANPVNFMGASKRLMEHVLFSAAAAPFEGRSATSARFANVAFSNGSLLRGWFHRLAKGQPLAVPADTRRFFISLAESGEICVVAAVLGLHRQILIPRLDPEHDLRALQPIAEAFLRHWGLHARCYDDQGEAMRRLASDRAEGAYPLVVTPLDTSGEKDFEEFVSDGERTLDVGFRAIEAVPYDVDPGEALPAFLALVERAVSEAHTPVSKANLAAAIGRVIPEFHHCETGKSLDDRL